MKYLHGCNYPWSTDGTTVFYGLDFGANVWGSHVGVSTRRSAVARDFDAMAALGFTVARWFVFCDGRAGIVYDDVGLPIGTDSYLFIDLDAGLEIARDAGIRIDLVRLAIRGNNAKRSGILVENRDVVRALQDLELIRYAPRLRRN